MQSFKQWRMLNESLFPMGLAKNPSVAPIQSQFQFDEKKNMDKNPKPDDDEEWDDEEEDDTDDEEGDDDSDGDNDADDKKADAKVSKKSCDDEDDDSFPAYMKKKGMKKKMKNECDCEDKKPLESDNDDEDDEDDDANDSENSKNKGGDDGEDEEMGGDGGDMKRPLGFMKKGMKKKMSKKMKKESTNPENDFLQSFNSYTAPENQMSSKDAWWNSVSNHFSNPDKKFSDGFTEYMEDYLIDPEVQKHFTHGNSQQHGPKPGETGYAPEGRVGQGNFFGS